MSIPLLGGDFMNSGTMPVSGGHAGPSSAKGGTNHFAVNPLQPRVHAITPITFVVTLGIAGLVLYAVTKS